MTQIAPAQPDHHFGPDLETAVGLRSAFEPKYRGDLRHTTLGSEKSQ